MDPDPSPDAPRLHESSSGDGVRGPADTSRPAGDAPPAGEARAPGGVDVPADGPGPPRGHPAGRPAPWWALPLIVAGAVGLRLFAHARMTVMDNDGPNFLWQAQRLGAGDWRAAVTHPYHPGYGAATAALEPLTGDVESAALAVSLLGSVALVVASWGLARRMFGPSGWAPAAAALAAAVNVRALNVGSEIRSDGLFVGLLLLGTWALVEAIEARGCRRRLALAGGLTGLTYLVRVEGLFLLLPLAVWVVAGGRLAALGARAGRAALAVVAMAVVAAPYVVAMHEVSGRWGLSFKPSVAAAGIGDAVGHLAHPDSPFGWPIVPRRPLALEERTGGAADGDGEPAGEDGSQAPGGSPSTGESAAPAIKKGAAGFRWPLLPAASPPRPPAAPAPADRPRLERPSLGEAALASLAQFANAARGEMILLLVPGLVVLCRRRRDLAAGLLLTVGAWFAVTTLHVSRSHFLANRHMIVPLALLLPVAGAGLLSWWRAGRWARLLVVLLVVYPAHVGTKPQRSHHESRLEALAWVREQTEPDQHVAVHRVRDGWYAERRALTVAMPCKDSHFLRRLREYDVPYAVFDPEKLTALHPHWIEEGWLEEVARFTEGGTTNVVYRTAVPNR